MTTVRIIIFIVGLLSFIKWESISPRTKLRHDRQSRLIFHVALASLNTIILRLVGVVPLFFVMEKTSEYGLGLNRVLKLDGWIEVIFSFLVLDVFIYFWHRLNHRVSFLWAFHKVHHSDTDLDTYTSLRFHPGEFLLGYVYKAIYIVILGPSLLAFMIFEILVTLSSQFHHSNIELHPAFETTLRKFWVTPKFHQAHHTVTTHSRNANYSTNFIFWDRLFRTYKRPEFENLSRMGLEDGRDRVLDFLFQLKAPFTKELK